MRSPFRNHPILLLTAVLSLAGISAEGALASIEQPEPTGPAAVPSPFAPGWYAKYQRLRRPTHLPQLRYSHLPSSRYVRAFRARRPVAPPPAAPAPVALPSRPTAPVASNVPTDVWERLRRCESGGRYNANTGNGYYGAYQFAAATWRSLGYPGLPHEAAPEVQDEAARRLQIRGGWGQWGACSRRLGLR